MKYLIFLSKIFIKVMIGNKKWMSLNNISVDEEVEQYIKEFEEKGNTVVFVAVDGKL